MARQFDTSKIMYFFNTRRWFVYAVGCGLSGLGVIFLALMPQLTSTFDLFDKLQSTQSRVSKLQLKASQLADAPQSLLVIETQTVNQALPSKKPLLELLTSLSNVSGRSNVRITDISLSPGKIASDSATPAGRAGAAGEATKGAEAPRPGGRSAKGRTAYDSLDLALTIEGNLAGVNNFLTGIENIAPLTTVKEVKLAEKSLADETLPDDLVEFRANLLITTYFYTSSVTAALDTPLPEFNASQEQTIAELKGFTFPTLEQQQFIQGGGLEDLFGVSTIEELELEAKATDAPTTVN